MQLSIVRSQRKGLGAVVFCLDARASYTPQETENIRRYGLGGQVIYNSEASRRLLDQAHYQNDGTFKGGFASLASVALASMKLNITINSLSRGQHIECKSLDELLGAEEAVVTACKNLRGYLDTAATFDGRQIVMSFDGDIETVAQATPQPALVVPPAALPAPEAFAFEPSDPLKPAPAMAAVASGPSFTAGRNADEIDRVIDWFRRTTLSGYVKMGFAVLVAFLFLHSCLHAV